MIRESCCCGATLEAKSTADSGRFSAREWRAAHAACRERYAKHGTPQTEDHKVGITDPVDRPFVALRPDSTGALDDVVVKGVEMFRAEMMDDDTLWLACYLTNGERIEWNVKSTGLVRNNVSLLAFKVWYMPTNVEWEAGSSLSTCCNAPVRTEDGEADFIGGVGECVTCWFVCTKCDQPCDFKEAPTKSQPLEAERDKALADVERLRQQNHDYAARRDAASAKLEAKVAYFENAYARARERLAPLRATWTTDPPSQEDDGWWRYTSANHKDEAAALVFDLTEAEAQVAALERTLKRAAADFKDYAREARLCEDHDFAAELERSAARCRDALRAAEAEVGGRDG